jgi:hypothetical protein
MVNRANTFEILSGFLDRFEAEVQGRTSLQEPTEEISRRLQQFARGELLESERVTMIDLLSRNPDWVWRLAQEVKALRPDSGASS